MFRGTVRISRIGAHSPGDDGAVGAFRVQALGEAAAAAAVSAQ